MRWLSTTGRESANRAYGAAGSARTPARNGLPPLRAIFATLMFALFVAAGLWAAPVDEIFGVWVLDRAAEASSADDTPRADGDLAIWQTDAGIGLTWNHLPPDPVRRTFEFARGTADRRLEVVRSDPPLAPGEILEARLEPNRLVVNIARTSSGIEQYARYTLFVHDSRLVFDYRLHQGLVTLESATRQLRRLKVVM